jgi:hypothetical protein
VSWEKGERQAIASLSGYALIVIGHWIVAENAVAALLIAPIRSAIVITVLSAAPAKDCQIYDEDREPGS